ncbi:hypothetical protein JYU34_005073 [Plutella xylostella]|uniref:Uncharacterized protein n=1 Tax=Plutella xylostella TaxID=51655 RepID=A0ABQ7QVS3_PLUXY|nr:hypothetical protein JYU34_005073 [Plutella xylostella]
MEMGVELSLSVYATARGLPIRHKRRASNPGGGVVAALAHFTGIAAKYPQEFKTMMQQSGELRLKLEAAVKASQQHSSRQRSAPQRPVFDTRPARPTIELKTDFSDFR